MSAGCRASSFFCSSATCCLWTSDSTSVVARHLLLVHEILHQPLLLQDLDDLLEVLLDALRRAGLLDFGHG